MLGTMNPKHEAAAALLAFHDQFLLHLNPTWPDVIVPAHLATQCTVVLHFGIQLAVPIPDFEITGWGVRGTLVFRGQFVYCQVPWDAVWAVQSAVDASKATVFHPERGWLAPVTRMHDRDADSCVAWRVKYDVQSRRQEKFSNRTVEETSPTSNRPAWFRGVIKGGKG